MTNDGNEKRLTGILEKVAIGALSFMFTVMWSDVEKLENKIERLQMSSFSTQNAADLEERITKNTNTLLAQVNSKLDLIIRIQSRPPSSRVDN